MSRDPIVFFNRAKIGTIGKLRINQFLTGTDFSKNDWLDPEIFVFVCTYAHFGWRTLTKQKTNKGIKIN